MQNKVYVYDENDNEIVIEVILSFKVEENGKNYIAYTLNDDDTSENVAVFISEYDGHSIKKIAPDEAEIVLNYYNACKDIIENEE